MKLNLKWMWLRHTYTFNWAHKPLCNRFKDGVLRLGNFHICRSCVFAYFGISIGIITSLLYPYIIEDLKTWNLILVLIPVIVLSYPQLYKRFPRILQDILRFAMGTVIGTIPFFLIYQNLMCGIISISVTFLFWRVYFHQRRIRKRKACDGCPELNVQQICSGFREQADAIRLYEIEATEYYYHKRYGNPN